MSMFTDSSSIAGSVATGVSSVLSGMSGASGVSGMSGASGSSAWSRQSQATKVSMFSTIAAKDVTGIDFGRQEVRTSAEAHRRYTRQQHSAAEEFGRRKAKRKSRDAHKRVLPGSRRDEFEKEEGFVRAVLPPRAETNLIQIAAALEEVLGDSHTSSEVSRSVDAMRVAFSDFSRVGPESSNRSMPAIPAKRSWPPTDEQVIADIRLQLDAAKESSPSGNRVPGSEDAPDELVAAVARGRGMGGEHASLTALVGAAHDAVGRSAGL